ncbi:Hypothetical predicted protein [Cloeon dipterum]|uniref:Uncharacterized protein n=1 Tax=Cloeon dipterum TaxID=197152 RepID=A0A8S1D7M3_9INSE|nr:Hypothetical predicted protein [Cloeon dipterum]
MVHPCSRNHSAARLEAMKTCVTLLLLVIAASALALPAPEPQKKPEARLFGLGGLGSSGSSWGGGSPWSGGFYGAPPGYYGYQPNRVRFDPLRGSYGTYNPFWGGAGGGRF